MSEVFSTVSSRRASAAAAPPPWRAEKAISAPPTSMNLATITDRFIATHALGYPPRSSAATFRRGACGGLISPQRASRPAVNGRPPPLWEVVGCAPAAVKGPLRRPPAALERRLSRGIGPSPVRSRHAWGSPGKPRCRCLSRPRCPLVLSACVLAGSASPAQSDTKDEKTPYPNCKISTLLPHGSRRSMDCAAWLAGVPANFPSTLAPLATASARVALKLGT